MAKRLSNITIPVSDLKEIVSFGVKFSSKPKNEHWGGRTATLTDPDRNKIVLVEYKED